MSEGEHRVPSDAAARERIRGDLDRTLFVEAAAGTGKTTALVGRLVALLRAGRASLDSVVALTFTEKAAGEMKLRLRGELEKHLRAAPAASAEAAHLRDALARLELARINTIHAFCNDLLRERPVEARVDPLFEVAAGDDQERLVAQAFGDWFEAAVADPPPGVRRVLRRPPTGANGANGPRETLYGAVRTLIEHRDFDAPWAGRPFDRDGEIDALVEEAAALGALAALSSWPEDFLTRNLHNIARWHAEVAQRERAVEGVRDYDGLEAELRQLARPKPTGWTWKGAARTRYGELSRNEVLARRDAFKARLDAFKDACEADLAPRLQQELRAVVTRYEALKTAAGRLDFLDLLIRARDLLVGDAGVRALMQRRFTHFFVDEFQDTDPLQAEIVLLLAADDPAETDWRNVRPVPGKLFVVGDPKQSIYRFRRADIAIYERIKQQLVAAGAEVLYLNTSFRSRPSIQRFVNAAFSRSMVGAHQAAYEPLAPWRDDTEVQPSVVVLPVPRPYGDFGKVVNFRIEESLPDAVGAFVDWLLRESGWRVEEAGRMVPVAPRHVCVLFRRFRSFGDDVTRPYVRALEHRRIPHVLVGGRSFHDREEVLALRNALAAIEWPDDELRVYATLRGPLFAIADEDLLAWRFVVEDGAEDADGGAHAAADRAVRRRALDPLATHEAARLSAQERSVAEALALLGELHRRRNRRPIGETVMRLLRAVRAHAGIAIWPTGEQALANVLRVVDLARRFEARGALSFRAFVEQMDADAEGGEAEDAPVVEEGTEGVRIMTAHKAKGLEFPVVILADPTCSRTSDRPSRHVDMNRRLWVERLCDCVPPQLADVADDERERDDEEAVRLTYVAATRARDLLVVPAVGDDPQPGWLDMLHPAVYPADHQRHLAVVAAGCPRFGTDSVLARPGNAAPLLPNVRPGRHRTADGEAEVVWWDPGEGGGLVLDVKESVGLRQQRILEADESGRDARGEAGHEAWQATRAATLAAGVEPRHQVTTATALALAAGEDAAPAADAGAAEAVPTVRVERVEAIDPARPGGRRFGTLVHAILATAPLDAPAAALERLAGVHGRLVGAPADEVAAAATAAAGALAHPLMRRAAACAAAGGDCRREVPVTHAAAGGGIVEGVVDLAFREVDGEARWIVVDFKTDREADALGPRYALQVCAYAAAIAAATGEAAEPVLLRV